MLLKIPSTRPFSPATKAGVPQPFPSPAKWPPRCCFTGIAGYMAYRRRMGAATEPNALHTLALGARGISDFRADKAA